MHIGKPAGSGGRVDVMTCTEQLIYEMHDPANYITPDCVLDIHRRHAAHDDGQDRVRIEACATLARHHDTLEQGHGRLFRRLDRRGPGVLCRP